MRPVLSNHAFDEFGSCFFHFNTHSSYRLLSYALEQVHFDAVLLLALVGASCLITRLDAVQRQANGRGPILGARVDADAGATLGQTIALQQVYSQGNENP